MMSKKDKILNSAAKCVFKWGKEEKTFRKLGSKEDFPEVSMGRTGEGRIRIHKGKWTICKFQTDVSVLRSSPIAQT